jgi:hypothetical protein
MPKKANNFAAPNRFSNMSGPSNSKSQSSPDHDEFADPLDEDDSYEEDIQDEINNSGDAFAQYQIEHVESSAKKQMTIDFQNDYEPLKLGIKQEHMLIVVEF